MKAVKIIMPGKIEVCDMPEPQIGPEDVLLKVKSLGLCGSDLKTYRGQNPMVNFPIIPGHEIAGKIVETGLNVPTELKPNSRVTITPYTSCGSCSSCKAGRVNCCRYNQTMGVQRDGAATEYITVHHSNILSADSLDYEQIACIEPLSVGRHATNRVVIGQNDTVLIFGCGIIGLGAIIFSSYKGAKVIAVDIDNTKLEKAQELGAQYSINSNEEDLENKVNKITNGAGPNVVIEAVGLPVTFRKAVDLVCFAGRVVYIGFTKVPVEYETTSFILKELDIKGSRNALKDEFKDIIDMLSSEKIDVKRLITQRYELSEIGEALRFWDKNQEQVIKIMALSD